MGLLNKAKIAFFVDSSYGLGGAGNLLLQQAGLMAEIYDVLVVLPRYKDGKTNNEYQKRCEQYKLKYTLLPYSTASNFCDIDFYGALTCIELIEKLAIDEKITIFHTVQLNIAVEYVARKLSIPHVMDIYQLREEEFQCCPGDIYPHYHLCDSEMYAERWSRMLGIESRCVRPVALLECMKKKNKYPEKEIHILMLGNIYERKNQLAAIKACELCKDRFEYTLTIAGSMTGKYAEKCIEYVTKNNLQKKVIFAGFVSDITQLLEENDCLLCASTDESFPSSIVEALTYDLTIISTPVAGVPEVFSDGENAFISNDFSINSIHECLIKCVESYRTGTIEDIKRNAACTWEKYFFRKSVRDQIDNFYYDISKCAVRKNHDFNIIENKVKQMLDLLSDVYKECDGMINRVLYHTELKNKLHAGKMYLWGAGKMGKYAYEILHIVCPQVEIVAFVDSYREGQYLGLPIIKPKELKINEKCLYGIAFVDGKEKAIEYFQEKGLHLNKQVWIVP